MSLGNLGAALVVARSRVLALALGVFSVLAPLCLSRQWPLFRTVVAFAFAAGYLRVVQLAYSTAGATTGSRVLAVTCLLIDPRRVVRVPPKLELRELIVGSVEIAIATVLFYLPRYPSGYGGTLLGACSAYFVVEGMARVAQTLVAAFGVEAGPFHDAPILARTVGEFWARRWNRAVHRWLSEWVFRPAARRVGVAGGVLAAFGASALLHAIPIWIALDLEHGLWMGSFFVLHGGIVVAESRLQVARWPRWAGHAWTLGVFAATLPLFVNPLLASLGRV